MSEFETVAIVGDFALVKVTDKETVSLYLGREGSTQGRYYKASVPEPVFRELASLYLLAEDLETAENGDETDKNLDPSSSGALPQQWD